MTAVLCLDIATSTGWAIVADRQQRDANDPDYRVIDAGLIRVPEAHRFGDRLLALFNAVLDILRSAPPLCAVFLECPPPEYRAGDTGRFLDRLATSAELAVSFSSLACKVWRVVPSDWQKEMFGGSYSTEWNKHLALQQAWQRAGYETVSDDEADAVCCGVYGLQLLKMGILEQRMMARTMRKRVIATEKARKTRAARGKR